MGVAHLSKKVRALAGVRGGFERHKFPTCPHALAAMPWHARESARKASGQAATAHDSCSFMYSALALQVLFNPSFCWRAAQWSQKEWDDCLLKPIQLSRQVILTFVTVLIVLYTSLGFAPSGLGQNCVRNLKTELAMEAVSSKASLGSFISHNISADCGECSLPSLGGVSHESAEFKNLWSWPGFRRMQLRSLLRPPRCSFVTRSLSGNMQLCSAD